VKAKGKGKSKSKTKTKTVINNICNKYIMSRARSSPEYNSNLNEHHVALRESYPDVYLAVKRGASDGWRSGAFRTKTGPGLWRTSPSEGTSKSVFIQSLVATTIANNYMDGFNACSTSPVHNAVDYEPHVASQMENYPGPVDAINYGSYLGTNYAKASLKGGMGLWRNSHMWPEESTDEDKAIHEFVIDEVRSAYLKGYNACKKSGGRKSRRNNRKSRRNNRKSRSNRR
jgi:hypothetical protein